MTRVTYGVVVLVAIVGLSLGLVGFSEGALLAGLGSDGPLSGDGDEVIDEPDASEVTLVETNDDEAISPLNEGRSLTNTTDGEYHLELRTDADLAQYRIVVAGNVTPGDTADIDDPEYPDSVSCENETCVIEGYVGSGGLDDYFIEGQIVETEADEPVTATLTHEFELDELEPADRLELWTDADLAEYRIVVDGEARPGEYADTHEHEYQDTVTCDDGTCVIEGYVTDVGFDDFYLDGEIVEAQLVETEPTNASMSAYLDGTPVEVGPPSDPDAALAVSITNVTDPVSVGEELTVTADVENTGDEPVDERLVLDMNGNETGSEAFVSLDPGEETTVTLTMWMSDDEPGERDVTVRSPDDSDTTTVEVTDESPIEFVDCQTVRITGDFEGIILDADDFRSIVFWFHVYQDQIEDEVGPIEGETEIDLRDILATTYAEEGESEFIPASIVSVGLAYDEPVDDVMTGDYHKGNPHLTDPASCEELKTGERSTADIAIGDQQSDGVTITVDEVDLSHGGFVAIYDEETLPASPESASNAVRGASEYLDAGTHENVSVDLNDPLGADDTVIAVVHRDTTASETFDFETARGYEDWWYFEEEKPSPIQDTATVTIDEPAAAFDVDIVNVTDPVVAGEPIEVTAAIENIGNETGEGEIDLDIDHEMSADSTTLSLEPNETETVTLTANTDEDAVFERNVTVRSQIDSQSVIIETIEEVESTATFEIASLNATDPVEPGDDVEVMAEITNVGEETGEQWIELNRLPMETPALDAEAIELEADESTTVMLTASTDEDDVGNLEFEVASENESEIIDVTVEEVTAPAEFEPTVLDVVDSIEVGQELIVPVEVENLGNETATQDVWLEVNGQETVDNESVSLDGGEATLIELAYETTTADVGELAISVHTENATDTATVLVEEATTPTPETATPTPEDTPTPTPEPPTPEPETPTPEPEEEPPTPEPEPEEEPPTPEPEPEEEPPEEEPPEEETPDEETPNG